MTVEDFSNEFDVLMNSWAYPIQQGNALSPVALNEYEKSIYLTRAQDDIIKSYFSAQLNPQGEGFGYSRKRDIDFSNIIVVHDGEQAEGGSKFSDEYGVLFKIPSNDILVLLNEECKATKDGQQQRLTVVPLSQDEYERVSLKPYRFPYKRQAWRLIHSGDDGSVIEIIPGFNYTDVKYKVRYVKYPAPIILENLTGSDLKIRNTQEQTNCTLSEELHPEILARAVQLAQQHIIGTVADINKAATGNSGRTE